MNFRHDLAATRFDNRFQRKFADVEALHARQIPLVSQLRPALNGFIARFRAPPRAGYLSPRQPLATPRARADPRAPGFVTSLLRIHV